MPNELSKLKVEEKVTSITNGLDDAVSLTNDDL